MLRSILSMLFFWILAITLAFNEIGIKNASFWVIMGCTVAIAFVYYFL